jgi:hypothetical protein
MKKKIGLDEHLDKYLKAKGFLPNGNFDSNPESSEVPNTKREFMIMTPDGVKSVSFENGNLKQTGINSGEVLKPTKQKKKDKVIPNFICDAQGEGYVTCHGMRCVAHIITRQCQVLKGSTKNRIYICKEHETYFNSKPIEFWFRFIKKNFPEKFNDIKSKYDFVINEYNLFMKIANEEI